MKTIAAIKKTSLQCMLFSGLLMIFLLPTNVFSQTDTGQKAATATAEPAITEEAPALISPTLEFKSVQKADNSIDLYAALRTKLKGNALKLPFLKVSFVQVTDTAEKTLGFIITDGSGRGVLNVKAEGLTPDKEGKLHFKAVFAGNKQMDPAEEEASFKRARLEIVPVKEDSLLTVKVKLIDLSTGTETPVAETVIGVFVHRSFNPLKLGEGTTDETGETTVEIPANLPGDAKGNIILIAKLDENEAYGNIEASATQAWGVPVSDKIEELPRALWSPHPPIWMVVTFALLMTVVWGHYIVIVYELIRLRKEEPHSTNQINS